MKEIIRKKLKEIEYAENVRIIMAVESGSRAWGFESPDSDYDIRFIYVRNAKDYLRVDEIRDVIEWQLDDVLDINGWDIKKALQLLYKSNPTVFEWCSSSIVYKTSLAFDQLKALKDEYFSPKKSLYHYWHMAEGNYRAYLQGDEVRIKKYFYVLRPLLAAKWVIDKKTPPPMLFSELIEAELDDTLKPEVEKFMKMKQELPEMGTAQKIPVLHDYIDRSLEECMKTAENMEDKAKDWNHLNDYFLSLFTNSMGVIVPEVRPVDRELISALIMATNKAEFTRNIFNMMNSDEEKEELIKYLAEEKDLTIKDISYKAFQITSANKERNV